MKFEWTIIYNDGNGITVIKESEMNWNDAPKENVQFLLCDYHGYRKAISGLDEYTIPIPDCKPKLGKLISDKEWALTRQFMIYGKY